MDLEKEMVGIKCSKCEKLYWVSMGNIEEINCCKKGVVQSGKLYGFRFPLNISNLNTSPERKFEIGLERELINLEKELRGFPPSAYIISGNRGVGKTTYINYLEKKFNQEEIVEEEEKSGFYKTLMRAKELFVHYFYNTPTKFLKESINFFRHPSNYKHNDIYLIVSCNFVKHDTKQHIIRKLIRSLIIKLNKHKDANVRINSWKNRKFRNTLNELFKKTFYEVTNNETKSKTRILSNVLEFTWIPVVFLIVYYLVPSVYQDMLKQIALDAKKGLEGNFVSNSIWQLILFVMLAFFVGKLTFSREKKHVNDQQIKTLYDDEIAELRLLESVKGLGDIGINVIFVIDELDKIEDDKAIETIVGELKPLFLSGTASFLLVTGQKYARKLEISKYEHDPILPSLFSNSYHIPLMKKESMIKLFEFIVKNPESNPAQSEFEKTQKLYYESFRDAMILRSNGITRKMIMQLRAKADWESSKRDGIAVDESDSISYVEITENDYIEYKNDQEIQKIIQIFYKEITENKDDKYTKVYKNEEKDFLLEFVHIIVRRIKDTIGEEFRKEDILVLESEEQTTETTYPSPFVKNYKRVLERFFILLNQHELVGKCESTEEELEVLYEYTPKRMSKEQFEAVQRKYLLEFNSILELIDEIIFEVRIPQTGDIESDFENAIKVLMLPGEDISYLKNRFKFLQEISELNNQNENQQLLKKYRREFVEFESKILESYLAYITPNIINSYKMGHTTSDTKAYSVINHVGPNFDIEIDLGENMGCLAIEIKTMSSNNASKFYIKKVIEDCERILERLEQKREAVKLILVMFVNDEIINKVERNIMELFIDRFENSHQQFKLVILNKSRASDQKTIQEQVEPVIRVLLSNENIATGQF
ncbi:P-loop NTPase fold protein [Bacillus cereus]|uniref:P-loop NTPase fold protein n=1 Tax=Bacillus cereus TaxID=1396 RepID=UPI00387A176B